MSETIRGGGMMERMKMCWGGKEMLKKVLAFASLICPVCNIARIFPGSKFARMMRKREENCPACKAYQEIFCKKEEKDER